MKSIRKKDKSRIYYKNEYDQYHRIDGPAAEYPNGDEYWLIYDQFHRIDGPAREYSNGDKFWYINGLYHRIDGPAIEHLNGTKRFFLFNKKYTETEHQYTTEHYDSFIDSKEYFGE